MERSISAHIVSKITSLPGNFLNFYLSIAGKLSLQHKMFYARKDTFVHRFAIRRTRQAYNILIEKSLRILFFNSKKCSHCSLRFCRLLFIIKNHGLGCCSQSKIGSDAEIRHDTYQIKTIPMPATVHKPDACVNDLPAHGSNWIGANRLGLNGR